MRVGPAATAADIRLHVETARTMRSYAGLLGRVRRLIARLDSWWTGKPEPPVGSRAWEAKLELQKLPGVLADRLKALADPNLDPRLRAKLQAEVAQLKAQVDGFRATLDELDAEAGRGYVAAETKPQAEVTKPKAEGEAAGEGKVTQREGGTGTEEAPLKQPVGGEPEVEGPPAPPRTLDQAVVDPGWQKNPHYKTLLKTLNLPENSRVVTADLFERIVSAAVRDGADPTTYLREFNNFFAAFRRAGAADSRANMTQVLEGLVSDSADVRRGAQFLLERTAASPGGGTQDPRLPNLSEVLKKFSLEEIAALQSKYKTRDVWIKEHLELGQLDKRPKAGEEAKNKLGEEAPQLTDANLYTALTELSTRVDADPTTLKKLIGEAGVGVKPGIDDPDLLRLHGIVDGIRGKTEPFRVADVRAAIERQNRIAEELGKSGKDLVDTVLAKLGEPVPVGKNSTKLEFAKLSRFAPTTGATSKVSGTDIVAFFRETKLVEGIVDNLMKAGLDRDARWTALANLFKNSDIDVQYRNNILGHYWEQLRLAELKAMGKEAYPQVPFRILETKLAPRPDAVIVESVDKTTNTVEISLEDCKTGDATLSRAQKALMDKVTAAKSGATADDLGLEVDLPKEVLIQLDRTKKITIKVKGFTTAPGPPQ
jgi:hypothetical protein